MKQVHFSARACTALAIFVVAFAALLSIDKGSGPISRVWPILMLCLLVGAMVAICARMWRARGNPYQVRRAEAEGLYGVLPESLRNWLFP
jgi:hypothetical protein